MGTRLRKSCVDESRSAGFPSSRSEPTTQTAAALKLNHLDIHDDDAGSQGAVVSNKKKRGQQRDARKNKSRRGLPQISMKVLEKVESKGRTTFNEVADELVAELADPMNSVLSPNKQQYDEKNVRRRAYDVLNVLMAMDIISKDKKEIQWKGLPPSAIEKLKIECLGIKNRIESKVSYLKEFEEQFVGLKNLVQRNEQLYRSGNPSSGDLSLPFVLVQTCPHATVELEVEISEENQNMQLVHFDFNSTLFELHDDYYVLKAMEFCDRPRRDIATLNVTEGGEGSSLSGLHQLQVPPSVSSVSIRPQASPPLSGILKLTGHHYNHHYSNDPKCHVEIDSLAKVNDTQFPLENSEYVLTAATVASSSDLSQFTNRNVTRKLTPISPGSYVLKRPGNLHCGDLNKATVTGSNENQSFYLECDENGEDCDVPDNELDPNVEIDGLPKVNDTQFPSENSENVSAAATGATVVTSQHWDIGEPTCICEHCGAMMWYEERVQKQYRSTTPTFAMCCSHGRIAIPHYLPLPQPLNDLFHKHDKRSKYFLDNIRSFNSMFAFTSMGGKVNKSINDGNAPPTFVMNGENYHQIGSLLPLPGIQPKFAQLYIYDTENEISNRMSVVRMKDDNSSLKATIVDDIMKVLDNHNPYAQTYRMIRDKMSENDVPILKLRILAKRGCDGRRYNLPTTSEVAALIVGDFDAADFERDIIVETQSGSLKRVSVFEPSYLPLQYPVLFPRGEDGYRNDIQLNDDSNAPTIKRKTITLREWFAYRIQQRITEQSTLLFSRRLFHQFLVDAYSMIESSRLKWVRTHQKDLRVEMYKGLTEAILRGEITPSTVGKRIVLPSSFVGGARYMFQNYQDAMTICGWAGYPDLFITFTCNHKWPELCGFLSKYKLKSEDRPDLVCRLFKIKLDHLIKEIKKG